MKRHASAFALGLAVVLATSATHAQQQQPPPPLQVTNEPGTQEPQRGSDDGFVDKLRRWADEKRLAERLNGDIDGWYPRLGGMTRGSGIALGPGYRRHVFDDRVLFDLSAGISTKGYKAVDANARWLRTLGERLEVWTDFRFEDFPQEDFFGTGVGSTLATRTSYDFDSADVAVRGVFKPTTFLRLGATLGYRRPDVGPGSDRSFPSIEMLFTDAEAPGLAEQPNFLHSTLSADVDYRDVPGNPRSGGFYHVALGIWDDRTLGQYDFRRFDANLLQFVPLVASKKHALSGRVGLSYVNNETGHRVPFYFLAYVGGVDTIRSFREFRFKDENALWLSAEYIWTLAKYVSVVTFVDAGEVRADWQDIGLTGLKTGYGFGFRGHTEKQILARLDFATGGGEGWRVFLKLGPSF